MKWLVSWLLVLPCLCAAQVDPSGTWRTLHTPHFRVHFRPEYRPLAVTAAAEAERAYALLASELHPPRGIIDVTLSDDVDSPNGFASTYPSNRITIYLVPPVADPALQAFDSWQRLVIVHELTHIFHLDRSRGVWRTVQSVLGRVPGSFPNQYQPSWVTEGLATYYESRFTAAGRAEGSFHRQIVAADALAGAARTPWDALLFTRWPTGLAPYAYGSRFWEHLSQTVSDSIVPHFVERSAGQLIPFRVGRPLRRAGAPRPLTEEWTRAANVGLPALTPGTRGRLIAGGLRSEPMARVSATGQVAYVHDDGRGARRLRVIDPVSGAVLRTHRVTGDVSLDWSADTLLVAQLDFADRWRVRSDLWKWTPDGAWQRVTTNARVSVPRVGGGVVAMLALTPGDNTPAITGPRSRPIADAPGTAWGAVVPSPDGRWIAATRHHAGHWALVRWPAAHPDSIAVLVEAGRGSIVADPTWTRDGTGILYVSDRSGFPEVHRWSAAQGSVAVTGDPIGARAPAVLADGSILFATLGHDGWELRLAPPAPPASRPVEPVAPAAPFDSAPPAAVPIRETGYAAWPSLRPHFWIPLALDAADAGFFVGAATAGGDALGRYAYFADATIAPSPLRAQGTFALVTDVLGDPSIDVAASNDWSLVGIDSSSGVVIAGQHREAALGVTTIARRWQRFVALRLAVEYDGRRYTTSIDTTMAAVCTGCRRRDLIGGSAALSFGTAVGAPLTVSLQDGFSAALLYRRREEQGTARWLNEVRGRVAVYARLGPRVGFAYPVLALRAATGAFDGPIVDRLAVGGVSSGATALALGQALGTTRTFPVRGFDAGTLRGRRAATVTAEYRVPLVLIGKSLGHLPLGADKLALAFFGDVGDTWEPGERARLHRLRSAGAELVADLTVSYDLPLSVRVGVAQPAHRHPVLYAAFGADF